MMSISPVSTVIFPKSETAMLSKCTPQFRKGFFGKMIFRQGGGGRGTPLAEKIRQAVFGSLPKGTFQKLLSGFFA